MLRCVDEHFFGYRCISPQNEDNRFFPLVQRSDDGIGQQLPAFSAMGIGFPAADSQDSIQQEYALLRPRCQVAVFRNRNAEVILQFLVDVDQGRRQFDPFLHGKA